MANKRFNELKNLSKDELTTKVRESEANLFQARMRKVTGQLSDVASIWRMRKDLARMKFLSGVTARGAKATETKAVRGK